MRGIHQCWIQVWVQVLCLGACSGLLPVAHISFSRWTGGRASEGGACWSEGDAYGAFWCERFLDRAKIIYIMYIPPSVSGIPGSRCNEAGPTPADAGPRRPTVRMFLPAALRALRTMRGGGRAYLACLVQGSRGTK